MLICPFLSSFPSGCTDHKVCRPALGTPSLFHRELFEGPPIQSLRCRLFPSLWNSWWSSWLDSWPFQEDWKEQGGTRFVCDQSIASKSREKDLGYWTQDRILFTCVLANLHWVILSSWMLSIVAFISAIRRFMRITTLPSW